jgi:hypothetical protein
MERPISFASSMLAGAQLNWAAIEKEAYAVIQALNKFRTWCFGVPIIVYSDSNPGMLVSRRAVFKGGGGFTGSNPPPPQKFWKKIF